MLTFVFHCKSLESEKATGNSETNTHVHYTDLTNFNI